ncbi:MAG: M56 family metallopeptidase [Bacillota bacterium]|nr:M56 family metallopeptidase [Bacillota bacterium]
MSWNEVKRMDLLQIDIVKMGLLQMSITGGVIILIVTLIRALLLNRLPKKAFLFLWVIALFRLAVPFSVTSGLSIYTLLPDQYVGMADAWNSGEREQALRNSSVVNTSINNGSEKAESDFEVVEEAVDTLKLNKIAGKRKASQIWPICYFAGMMLCGGYFVFAYIRCRRKFRESLPVDERIVSEWLDTHPLRRLIYVRRSGCVCAPLSYGIIRPVILMPGNIDLSDGERLYFVLEHEFVHIKRFDALTKLILTCILCIHWFNPAVWLLYVLFNRDLELSCDEAVVRHFGESAKGDYARTLISMEEKKSGLLPLCNSFSKNAIEQRIKAVMKIRKPSFPVIAVAGVLIVAVFVCFATYAGTSERGKYLKAALDGLYTEEEGEMLAAVWLDGYESMTVSEYQEKLWKMTDTWEYRDLLKEFSNTDWAIESSDKEDEVLWEFIRYFGEVLEPLTAEKWQTRQFSGFTVSGFSEPEENATLEYVVTMTILKPKELTTAQYRDARLKSEEALHTFIQERTHEELADEQLMVELIEEETGRIASEISSEKLKVSIESYYTGLDNELRLQVMAQYDEVLEPYRKFGLTWTWEPPYGFEMYFQGKEVRGIYDEKNSQWISEHSGNSTYASDAIDLYTVYEGDLLTGLRQATEEEQKVWTALRENGADW